MLRLRTVLAAASLLALTATAAHADVIVAGNSAAFGSGPIGTFDFTTNTAVGSFIPDGAFDSNNGRGLAMTLDRYFYTELLGGFGATDFIRIAPYNGGAGGADIGTFANPAPGQGVQALAFGALGLYVLTGYPAGTPTVHILNGVTGTPVAAPIVLQGADPGMDGFTVLPDGSFFGNLGDAVNIYQRWDAAGNQIGPTFSVPTCGSATGVDIAPDGLSLFFMCDFGRYVQTDIAPVLLGAGSLTVLASINAPGGLWEDIGTQQQFVCTSPDGCVPVTAPEPVTMALFGLGAAGLAAARRRAAKNG